MLAARLHGLPLVSRLQLHRLQVGAMLRVQSASKLQLAIAWAVSSDDLAFAYICIWCDALLSIYWGVYSTVLVLVHVEAASVCNRLAIVI